METKLSQSSSPLPILIVGGGIAGAMLSWELIRRGLRAGTDFAVIDAGFQYGSSAQSTGLINPVVFKRMTLSWGANLVPKAWESYLALEELLRQRDGDIGFVDRRPIIRLFRNQREQESWQLAFHDGLLDPISQGGESAAIFELSGRAAAAIPGSGRIRPTELMEGVKSLLVGSDAWIEGELRWGDEITVATSPSASPDKPAPRLPFHPAGIVFATGIQFRYRPGSRWKLPDAALPFYPVKGDVLLMEADELDDVSRGRILSAGIAIIPGEHSSHYEIGSSYIRDFTDASPDEGGARWLLDQLGALGILDRDELHKRIRGRRAGIRPASRDRLAYLGPMKSQGPAGCRIFVFNGLGTRGYMLAPAQAGMLADHILDGSAIPSELMPDRVAGVS
jgi:glycine/D-amino acid oxidase-like deaminating enzyme